MTQHGIDDIMSTEAAARLAECLDGLTATAEKDGLLVETAGNHAVLETNFTSCNASDVLSYAQQTWNGKR